MQLHQRGPDNGGLYFILMQLINCRAAASPFLTLQMTGDCSARSQPLNQIIDRAHNIVIFIGLKGTDSLQRERADWRGQSGRTGLKKEEKLR